MRFSCQPGCIHCCERPGLVYLTRADVPRIAAYLGLSLQLFRQRFVANRPRRLRFAESEGCPFLEGNGCSIHEVKPLQCRAYPFWPGLVGERRALREEAKSCPGIGQGQLVQIQVARAIAAEVDAELPGLFP